MKSGAKTVRALNPPERLEDRAVPAAPTPTGLAQAASAFYSINGFGNNAANPAWGAAGADLLRLAPSEYGDGLNTPAGAGRPSARAVSNAVADQAGSDEISDRRLSAMIYAWGQFLDHDLGLTVGGASERLPIAVPAGDPSFDPAGTGAATIPMTRSAFDPATGTTTPREQINAITAWLDGSMVYGSDPTTAAALRSFLGGRLKVGEGGLLPANDAAGFPGGTLDMANDARRVADDRLFAAGDVRANENIELTALHTLFVREHNRLADAIAAADPTLGDEALYQLARARVIAEIQSITYNEWLPALLGPGAIPAYKGYDPTANPGLSNEFATAAFRLGHSLLGDDVAFLGDDGLAVADEVALKDAFSNPDLLRATGIDPVLKYLVSDPASELDSRVVDGVRNFLFGPPGSGGLDLASLNIQRGRDHGLADYNAVREAIGLPRVTDFGQITSDPTLREALRSLYGSVDDVDLWVGGLAEDHVPGGSVGPTFRAILADQFARLRDGDRLWYQNILTGAALKEVEGTRLSDVIDRNTGLDLLQRDAFVFDAGVRGVVFGDANRDGRQNPNERAIAGRSVDLIDATTGEVVATATTDARGRYAFGVDEGLRTGRYRVRVAGAGAAAAGTTSAVVAIQRGGQFREVNVGLSVPGGPTRPTRPNRPAANPGRPSTPAVLPPAPARGGRPIRAASSTPRARPDATDAAAAIARRVFDGIRRDVLNQARQRLSPSRFDAFAAGLDGRRGSGS